MSTIQIVLTSWLALGLLAVAVIEITSRASGDDGPLSQDSVVGSVVLTLGLIVGAPALAVYVLAQSLKMLWEGRIPIVRRAWWPARAYRVDRRHCIASEGPNSRTVIICDMIEVRRQKDKRLSGYDPWDYESSACWSSTETMILDEASNFHWLLDGGFSELEAVKSLQSLDETVDPDQQATTLRALIERKLSIADPSYLDLPPDILTKSIALATTWARKLIHREKSSPYPPNEWLAGKIGFGDRLPPLFDSRPSSLADTQWRYFRARMTDSDELRLFCSPGDTWANLAGRAGVALVRKGRAIAHIITALN